MTDSTEQLGSVVRHKMGFKAPRGFGWLTNPKRAAYNRGCLVILAPLIAVPGISAVAILGWLILA
jgi:hypothetical protein